MTHLPAPVRGAPDADDVVFSRPDFLTPADPAALPLGAFRLAPDGRVLSWHPPVGTPDCHATADPVGRNFFRDIAPAELGRCIGPSFARGVANDDLKLTVEYRFDGEPQPSLWLHLGGNRREGLLLVLRRIR